MHIYRFVVPLLTIALCTAAEFKALEELLRQNFTDQTEIVRLASEEKFSIPVNGKCLGYQIEYTPQQSESYCSFKEPSVEYKRLAQSSKIFQENDKIVDMLVLHRSEKVILADPFYNIVIYSIDEHKLLRLLSPKTSLLQNNSGASKSNREANVVSMVTTEEEDFVYYLSTGKSLVFGSKSHGTTIKELNIEISSLSKALYFESHVVVLSENRGVSVFKVNKTSHELTEIQGIGHQEVVESVSPESGRDESDASSRALPLPTKFIDMELDEESSTLYVLTDASVLVYLFAEQAFPDPRTHEFGVLKFLDSIDLFDHTKKHQMSEAENSRHLNLEISRRDPGSEGKALFVLFRHNMRQNVVAEFSYSQSASEVTFIRFFKFQMLIHEIHAIDDVLMVVGNEILGMFPFGVDPRLIREEFNGWITMGNIEKVAVKEAPYFVGVTKDAVEYGGLLFSREAGLNCQFPEEDGSGLSSTTKSVTFSANLTWCGGHNQDPSGSYNHYCAYSKKFVLEGMDIVTSSRVSESVWLLMLVATVGIVIGILIMLILHKQKEDEIRKLELYFDQRRNSDVVPQSSDRRGAHGGSDD